MAKDGKLKLRLQDVYGELLREKVDISFRNQTLSDSRVVSKSASTEVLVTGLLSEPQGLYRIEVDPPSYLPISQFVRVRAGAKLEMTFPVDPKKVRSVEFPKFPELATDLRKLLEKSDTVLSFEGIKGEALFGALDDVRTAGLLNIFKKAANTPLSSGKTVFPFIQKLTKLRGDRFFAVVSRQLREETKNSIPEGLFHEASGLLHDPPEGFSPDGSFKTDDRYGNLQLSFFVKGDESAADIDIDDASGLEHVFQVLRNTLSGRPTHPYDIHQILIAHQRLDPGYRLVV